MKPSRGARTSRLNNWKYIQIAKRETPIKKRKLEPEDTPEPVSVLPETECQECQIVCEP